MWKLLGELSQYEENLRKQEYENNHIVATIKKLVQQGHDVWKGQIKDIISASKYFNMQIYDSAKSIGKKMPAIAKDLQLYDGIYLNICSY